MKNCKRLLCFLIIILEVITSITTTPINDLNFENIQKIIAHNEEATAIDDHLLNHIHNSDQDHISICWAESLIITENKLTKNKTMSKSYSIMLDAPENLKNLHNESENASCVEILEHNDKPRKALNFTVLKETDQYVIKEHKTLFCGAGPVLSHHFIVWPKLNRKQIQISINPLSSTKWKNCRENQTDSIVGKSLHKSEKPPKRRQTISESIRTHTKEKKHYINSKNSEESDSFEDSEAMPDDNEEDTPFFNIGAMHGGNKKQKVSVTSPKQPKNYLQDDNEEDTPSFNIGAMHGGNKKQKVSITSPKQPKNYLLRRDINCTIDGLGTCRDMIEKSNEMLGYKNNSQAVIGKWFFLDHIDNDIDIDPSFKLKVKIIVNMENDSKRNNGKRTELVMEEDCYYVIPQN